MIYLLTESSGALAVKGQQLSYAHGIAERFAGVRIFPGRRHVEKGVYLAKRGKDASQQNKER